MTAFCPATTKVITKALRAVNTAAAIADRNLDHRARTLHAMSERLQAMQAPAPLRLSDDAAAGLRQFLSARGAAIASAKERADG